MARAHISLPDDLLREVDRLAGRRRRSRFVEDAVREKVMREAQSTALAESAGTLRPFDYPQWADPEKAAAWVERVREEGRMSHDRGSGS